MHAPGYQQRKKKLRAKNRKYTAKAADKWNKFEKKNRKQENICEKHPTSRRCQRAQKKAIDAGFKYDRTRNKRTKVRKKLATKYYD